MGATAIVTDSTSTLTEADARARDVLVVPLQVIVDGASFREGEEIRPDELAEALRRGATVSTSRPAAAEFVAVYERAAAAGAQQIVSLHLSGAISGTYESARLAARQVSVPVTVVDTQQVAMGLGFAVRAAAGAAAAGGGVDAVVAAAARSAEGTRTCFYVDTLDYLRRGGRVSTSRALVGTVLSVKPLLEVQAGRIELMEKVRTSSRAIRRLEELAVQSARPGACRVAVHHLASEERARLLAEHLAARVRPSEPVVVTEVGAVLGAHVGPGLLGVIVADDVHSDRPTR